VVGTYRPLAITVEIEMFKRLLIAAVIVLASVPAHADRVLRHFASNWVLFASDKGGCYLGKQYPQGTVLTIQLKTDWSGLIVTISSDRLMGDPKLIGSAYEVVLMIDSGEPWRGHAIIRSYTDSATGRQKPMFVLSFEPAFAEQFAAGGEMTIWAGGQRMTTVGLGGTKEATMKLLECEGSSRRSQAPTEPLPRQFRM
jgi:hypothetical protein